MKRSKLWAGLAVLAVSLVASAGTASARSSTPNVVGKETPGTCVVHSLKSFTAQGNEGTKIKNETVNTTATVGDIVEVECNPVIYGTGSKIKITAAQLYSRCAKKLTWYVPNPFKPESGIGVSVPLDADGNATVALIAGPGCQAGDGMIDAHMEEEPFESFATSFAVLPPENTKPGVYPLPLTQVEGGFSSSVATIVQVEFAAGSEKLVHIGAEELYSRCRLAPHLRWFAMNGAESKEVSELKGVELDDNGNAFVLVLGDSSCAEGASLIEADLESKPFTTFEEDFTVESPRPTEF